MDHRIIWLPIALDELDEVGVFISRDSSAAASSVVKAIRDSTRDLAIYPLMGPRVPEWNEEEHRQRVVFSYRLIYRVKPEVVEVLAVWHGARLLPTSIRRRQL